MESVPPFCCVESNGDLEFADLSHLFADFFIDSSSMDTQLSAQFHINKLFGKLGYLLNFLCNFLFGLFPRVFMPFYCYRL